MKMLTLLGLLFVAPVFSSELPNLNNPDELPLQSGEFSHWAGSAQVAEVTWQALNVVDTAQTVMIARSPTCFKESDAISQGIIGEHPTQAKVYLLGIGYGVLHYTVTRFIEERDIRDEEGYPESPWWLAHIAWHTLTLIYKADTVVNNNIIGLRMWGGETTCRVK